jgi:hypothetical protein
MKATIEFNLSDPKQKRLYKLYNKAEAMNSALVEITHNLRHNAEAIANNGDIVNEDIKRGIDAVIHIINRVLEDENLSHKDFNIG